VQEPWAVSGVQEQQGVSGVVRARARRLFRVPGLPPGYNLRNRKRARSGERGSRARPGPWEGNV